MRAQVIELDSVTYVCQSELVVGPYRKGCGASDVLTPLLFSSGNFQMRITFNCWNWSLWQKWALGASVSAFLVFMLSFAASSLTEYFLRLESNLTSSFAGLYGGGTLLIAGGGDLPPEIPSRFRELAGGTKAKIVIIPSYNATPNEERDLIREWKLQRVASVDVLQARSREDAENDRLLDKIRNATGVWFTGGEQSIPAAIYPGTTAETELWNLVERGGVIGGTSAGAAIMSRIMISEGRLEAKICQGLDLMRGAVIDQHFMQRNRLTRLRGVLDQHPQAIGIGIDEATALVVHVKTGRIGVIGKSYVMLWAPSEQPSPQRAEFLKAGDSYCLDQLDWQNEALEYQM